MRFPRGWIEIQFLLHLTRKTTLVILLLKYQNNVFLSQYQSGFFFYDCLIIIRQSGFPTARIFASIAARPIPPPAWRNFAFKRKEFRTMTTITSYRYGRVFSILVWIAPWILLCQPHKLRYRWYCRCFAECFSFEKVKWPGRIYFHLLGRHANILLHINVVRFSYAKSKR